MICQYYPEPAWLVFSTEVPPLLYYSHIPTIIIALLVGLFVYFNGRKLLQNRLLLALTSAFSLWVFLNLVAWTNINSGVILFSWSLFNVLTTLISLLALYLTFVFLKKKDLSGVQKLLLFLLLLPILVFTPTDINLSGFDLSVCGAFNFEGIYSTHYVSLVGALSLISIAYLLITSFFTSKGDDRKKIIYFGSGIVAFVGLFLFMTMFATYLAIEGVTDDSRLEMFGLFGMDIFAVALAGMIVKFKSFNSQMISTQALVIGLVILIGSLFFFEMSTTGKTFVAISVGLALLGGYLLIRSVQKEIEQRKELEKLTAALGKANTRLKELDKLKSEFVSIASHQLRSPLTSIRGYASLLTEGSFGQIPEKAVEPLQRIEESARLMALAVEDYLNVSRIESGNMKYNLADFNLKDEVEKVTDDIRPNAIKKGLVMLFKNKLNSRGIVKADIGKAVQIIHNLVNNSLKYTPQGSITILVRDDIQKKRIFVDIIDTGIGMSQATMEKVFEKFERADNANSVNVSGTGLGLYVALKMANAMGGNITCTSEGDGKGSTFTLDLPLVS